MPTLSRLPRPPLDASDTSTTPWSSDWEPEPTGERAASNPALTQYLGLFACPVEGHLDPAGRVSVGYAVAEHHAWERALAGLSGAVEVLS